jgi:N-acetylglucosamine kinase-like BadF-type ATPase
MNRLVVGVDGGGTKTEAVLASVNTSGETRVLGRGLSGPSNMRLAGKEQTLASLDEAIGAAISGHPLNGDKIDVAVLALAGSDFSDVRHEINRWAEQHDLIDRIVIINDAAPVMAAGTPERWGVALVVGTGSVAIGIDEAGRSITRGGWGHWYGDKGSGYDLGCRALAAVSEAQDGMGPETSLTDRMLEYFALGNPRLIIQKLYFGGNVRSHIAAAAPVVLAAAEEGDIVAMRIVDKCIGELVRLVTAVTCDLEFSDDYPLALAGGVVCKHAGYRAALEASLGSINPAPGIVTPVPQPVMGAIRIGKDYLES